MLISNAIPLAVTFMDLMVRVMKDETASRTYAGDGNSLTISSSIFPGYDLKLKGSGFVSGTDEGQVQSFEIVRRSNGDILDGLFPIQMLLTQMILAVLAGSGFVKPSNYAAFYGLIMPSVFLQLLYTGHIGRDVAEGFGGDDVFDFFDGNDHVFLSGGNDEINGGDGSRDSVSGTYLENGIRVNLATGEIKEKNTDNVTAVSGVEDVVGTAQDDAIFGSSGSNRLNGGAGNDILDGRGGSDILTGGSGRDTLKGGLGNDILKGGPGPDRFVFDLNGGTDRIKDFEDNLDRLDLRRLGFDTLDQVEAAATEQNGDVVITNGGTTIVVENITKAALFDGDVIF